MATSIALTQSQPLGIFRRIGQLIPGLLLLVAVGYAGKFIERSIAQYGRGHHLTLPNIEYVLWAILLGLVIANTTGVPAAFKPGLATYEFWLKAGIVLLGSRLLLGAGSQPRGVHAARAACWATVSNPAASASSSSPSKSRSRSPS